MKKQKPTAERCSPETKKDQKIKREGLILQEDDSAGFAEDQAPYQGPSRALKAALDAVEGMGKKKPH